VYVVRKIRALRDPRELLRRSAAHADASPRLPKLVRQID
jgi:hypothetical protein